MAMIARMEVKWMTLDMVCAVHHPEKSMSVKATSMTATPTIAPKPWPRTSCFMGFLRLAGT